VAENGKILPPVKQNCGWKMHLTDNHLWIRLVIADGISCWMLDPFAQLWTIAALILERAESELMKSTGKQLRR
jgi:hypothetical protein